MVDNTCNVPEAKCDTRLVRLRPVNLAGAQLTLNLVSKMMLTMFPANTPFYKADLTDEQYKLILSSVR